MPFRLRLPFWPKKKDYSKKKPLPEPKTRLGKAWRRTINFRRATLLATKRAAYLVALMHVFSNAAYFGNYARNKISPSELRREFQRVHGIELQGWREDIEEKPKLMAALSDAVYLERAERPFDLGWFKIESDNYLKKHFADQMSWLLLNGHGGYTVGNHISANAKQEDAFAMANLIHHEIKHVKAFAVQAAHPEFEQEWRKLSVGDGGDDLYLTTGQNLAYWFDPLKKVIPPKSLSPEECLRQGFITPYARTHYREDVAELCAAAEDAFKWRELYDILYGKNPNPRIAAKIKLAQRYGLIPGEFSEFLRWHFTTIDLINAIAPEGSGEPAMTVENYLRGTADFIKRHPDSVYLSEMYTSRAWFLRSGPLEAQSTRAAIAEYKKALRCKVKASYPEALLELEEMYNVMGDHATAEKYRDAYTYYWKRFHAGDPTLSIYGINDYLKERGLLD